MATKRLLRKIQLVVLGTAVAIALSTLCSWFWGLHAQTGSTLNDPRVAEIEQTWQTQYHNYFGIPNAEPPMAAEEIRATLERISQDTQARFALLYIFPHPDDLELVLLAPNQQAIQLSFTDVPEEILDEALVEFRGVTSNPVRSGRNLAAAQQLYDWIIAPVEADLEAWSIDTLVLCVGEGIRSTPLAALYDGQQYLVEKYDLSVIPAFSLIDKRQDPENRARILAMGASEFEELNALPAVPVELREIDQDQWTSEVFINEDFTRLNLVEQLASDEFAIVHLATHAAFESGTPDNSFIQLWQDDRISLDEMSGLGWRDRPIDLLVLSACETALGDLQAEMGFAGLSFHSGVRTTLASLWQVSDVGSLALMREFYWQLAQDDVVTKAQALKRTQLSMLDGRVYVKDGVLYSSGDRLSLPDTLAQSYIDFTSPYNWAGFTLVGSPW